VVTKTLLADEAAVYDPRDPNDRLLLASISTLPSCANILS
jgi:hypothetical protein